MKRTKVPKGYIRLRLKCYVNSDNYKTVRYHKRDVDHVGQLFPFYSSKSSWQPWKNDLCIYILMHKGQVVYIGRAEVIRKRLRQHFVQGKIFNEVRLFRSENYEEIEKRMIRNFDPPLNKMKY